MTDEKVKCMYCELNWLRDVNDNESGWAISDSGIIDVCDICYNHKELRKINVHITLEKDYD